MLKYVIVASALKFFSSTDSTRRIYRHLGNKYGSQGRVKKGLRNYYVSRASRFFNLCRKFDVLHSGDRILELGTGWLHWESTLIRLLYEGNAYLFDVQDNRQLPALKQYFRDMERVIDDALEIPAESRDRVHDLLHQIDQVEDLPAFYQLLNAQYVLEPSGSLSSLPDQSFDFIFSSDVMEHIDQAIVYDYVKDFRRLLKVGGYSIHKIVISDHLSHYDRQACPKNYLRYSDQIWSTFFENKVQYINRIQRPEWLKIFAEANLELLDEELRFCDISSIRPDKKYQHLSQEDLRCTSMTVIHRKLV